MSRVTDTRWRLVADVEFLTHEWGDELVLYHGGSGDTHLLDGPARQIYRILLQHPGSTEDLMKVEIAFQSDVSPILNKLQRLDIVEPVSL